MRKIQDQPADQSDFRFKKETISIEIVNRIPLELLLMIKCTLLNAFPQNLTSLRGQKILKSKLQSAYCSKQMPTEAPPGNCTLAVIFKLKKPYGK